MLNNRLATLKVSGNLPLVSYSTFRQLNKHEKNVDTIKILTAVAIA